MDYGEILSRAWKITWNNKILWLFGLFAGTGASLNTGNGGSGGGDGGGGFEGGPGGGLPPNIERQLERPEVIAIILAITGVLLLIVVALIVLSIIARGGLIGGIRLADDNGKVTFREAWSIGLRYFWRIFGMAIMLVAPILVGVMLYAGFAFITFGFGALCALPLLCLLIIAYIPYSVVVWLGQIGVVVDDLNVFDGLRKGWELLKNNVAHVIVLGVILFVVGFVIGVVTLIPVTVVAFPAVLAFVIDPEKPNVPLLVGAGIAFLCLLPILWLAGSVLTTWIYSVWTLAYRKLTGSVASPVVAQPA